MWYMTLPSIIIIAVCSTIPAYVAPHITKFFQGNVSNFSNLNITTFKYYLNVLKY